MPHCERHLYNTVLALCWGPMLERVTIFGNSFLKFYAAGEGPPDAWSYMDALVARGVAVETPCLHASKSLSYEAFNDLSIVRFESAQLPSAVHADDFWRWRPSVPAPASKAP
jgi:hypothetical protein